MKGSNVVSRSFFLAVFLIALAGPAFADNDQRKQAAEQAAASWLEVVEKGEYGETWDQAAAFFREAVARDAWIEAMQQTRAPLGAVSSRELVSTNFANELPNVPEGDYVVFQYKTVFAERPNAAEMITLKMDDGSWKTSGYFIR
jgi:hypothetical protein